MSLGGGGLLGTVDPAGVVLPGRHGLATVAEVPLGRDGVAEAIVEFEVLPLLVVVLPVVEDGLLVVEDELPGVVEVEVLALVLLEGVHGATVVVVPVWFCVVPCVPPVTDPALPATAGVPGVTDGLPVVLAPGGEVCKVPVEPGVVDVVPGWVEVVPGCVLVVPGWDCVDDAPVCGPIPGLGVTVPVFCAVAMPADSANTDAANKILRIEAAPCELFAAELQPQLQLLSNFSA